MSLKLTTIITAGTMAIIRLISSSNRMANVKVHKMAIKPTPDVAITGQSCPNNIKTMHTNTNAVMGNTVAME